MDTIALIAHDGRKDEMAGFVATHAESLKGFKLIATSSTGKLIKETAGFDVELMGHGPEGGDVLVAAEVIKGNIAMVFFFVEPRDVHPHDPDIKTLMRVCDLHNVPLATNPASGDLMLTGWMAQMGD